MPDAQHCLAMAEEADRLACVVSYGRDKVRLKAQAESWRERAQAMAAAPPPTVAVEHRSFAVIGWLRRRKA